MQEGDLVADRFRIEGRAGEGAMGTVFRARDQASSKLVALKTFRIDGGLPLLAPRFAREAAALAELDHPGVVRYVAHGTSGGQPFLAMEWIDGPNLAECLADRGLHALDALRLSQRLAGALVALHARGIVHRDLKPSNVMLPGGRAQQAQIVDFGVARSAGQSAALTAVGAQLGTPRYMAPEQIRDPHTVDGRADVFALGCVLYECLTGVPAFGGDDPVAVLARILFQRAAEPSLLVPALPETVDRLLARMLARRSVERPTAALLEEELARLLEASAAAALAQLPAVRAAGSSHTPSPMQAERASPVVWTATAERDLPPLRPSYELRALALTLLPAVLPASSGALIGRAAELAWLAAALASGAPIAIWGGAGMGKTRLALALCEGALAAPPQPFAAAWFVDLSAARTTEDVVRLLAEQARLSLPAGDDAEARLAGLLAKVGRTVAVLDRVELLAGQIEPLLQLFRSAAPELCLIVTSRVRLQLEHALELGPLPTDASARAARSSPPAIAPAGAPAALSDGARMVLERVRAVLPDLAAQDALPPTTWRTLERIAAALDGIPLAIELAAARVGLLGLDGLEQRLTAQLELLGADGRRAGHARAETMRDAVGWSFALLQPEEREVFIQCALFRDGFTPAAAEAVLAAQTATPPLLERLQSLREQSLLVAHAGAAGAQRVRLSMFAPVREFAREQLALRGGEPLLAGAELRHARYYAALGTELAQRARQAGESDAGARLAAERGNLIAAAEYALAAAPVDLDCALQALIALGPVLLAGGPGAEPAALLERALALAPSAASRPRAGLLSRALQLRARLWTPGKLADARRDLAQVLAVAEHEHDRALAASAWLDLGVAHHFARELEPARGCYETALEHLAECDDPVSEARCHGNLAALAHDRGELARAIPGYRRAIALLESADEARTLANFCGNLGLCEHELGQLAAARAHYDRAMTLLEALGDARLLGIVLGNLGTLELAAGSAEQALQLHERACALLENGGDAHSEGLGLARRAVALAHVDRLEEAERHLVRAERVLRRDVLGRTTAELLRGFVELGFARRHAGAGAFDAAAAELAGAQARVERAQEASAKQAGGDDLRLYMELLAPAIEQERSALTNGSGTGSSTG